VIDFGVISLDQTDSSQVESPGHLDVFLGNPNRHLVICSGIAILSGVSSDGDEATAMLRIRLPVKATALLTWTAIAGLASIQNDDSLYTFATDSAVPTLDVNGNAFLNVKVFVYGEPSTLNRISYQTHLLITLDQPVISGTIQWSDAEVAAVGGPPRFQVAAGIEIAGAPGGFEQFQVLFSGSEDAGSETVQGHLHTVSYSLQVPIAQLGTPLLMQAQVIPTTLTTVGGPGRIAVNQVHGPDPVTLTAAHLVESDVNFAVTVIQTPK
jgi:hypothetical protein